jgi:hypothetical protein
VVLVLVVGAEVVEDGQRDERLDSEDRHHTHDSAEVAKRLRVRAGTLLVTLFQVDSTADGVVVLVSREHHLADAFEFSLYRRGPGESEEQE